MRHLVLLAAFLLVPAAAFALQITSISPSAAGSGETVTLTGGPFTPDTRIQVGETTVRPGAVERSRLTFTIPDLPPGDYLVQVVREREETPRQTFTLRIVSPVPSITAVTPEAVDLCRLRQGVRVSVTGRFPTGTRLLLDGTAMAATGTSESELTFTVPSVRGGLHQIEAVGPDGRRSLPHPLAVEALPRIFSAQPGEENVLSYEVVITGENFLFDSILVVNDISVNAPRTTAGSETLPPQLLPRKDYVRYVDCNTLIYIRHPVSSDPKPVTLQVVNPGGEQSRVYQVSIP